MDKKKEISQLSRAQYQYDRLISDFAEHYLELERAEYLPMPDKKIFDIWLRHLHTELRPKLLNAQQAMASHFGFQLGDRIKAHDVELYVFKISCYPLELVVRLEGYSVKKDGKPALSPASVEIKETSNVERLKGALPAEVLEPLLFPFSTRLANVKHLIEETIRSFI